jgi:D-methionine transport system ATP-binding protein
MYLINIIRGANMSEIISVRNLTKKFENGVYALQNVNLSIEKGDIFGIIGMSGAGKSTLIRCLNYLEKPSEGDVVVNGKNLAEQSEHELRLIRRNMGMIFQNFNLLMQKTVLENVQFPLHIQGIEKSEGKRRAQELLTMVGLEEKEKAYPVQLSGGQKQRVAIARALASNPEILLLDEATSALDPKTTVAILELLKEIQKKYQVTIVLITHEMEVVKAICNKVVILEDGYLVEEGSVECLNKRFG